MKTPTLLRPFLLIALVLCCGFSACQTLSDRIPLQLKSKAEQDIATLNASYQAQLKVV